MNSKGQFPEKVILGTTDIIDNFNNRVQGIFNPIDLHEIVTQIISMLLNDDSGIIEYGDSFPDYTRLIDTGFLRNNESILIIEKAVHEMVKAVHSRLVENGVFCDNSLPYFFDRFLDRDIVLHHLPF